MPFIQHVVFYTTLQRVLYTARCILHNTATRVYGRFINHNKLQNQRSKNVCYITKTNVGSELNNKVVIAEIQRLTLFVTIQ